MTKNITRTFTITVATVEVFKRDKREQSTQIFEYDEKVDEDFINRDLYKKYEKGANEMPLFIHEITYVEKKYSMPIEEFLKNAVLIDVAD